MNNLTYLSDQIGPRLTGSANLKRANEWTAEKMKEYGLVNVHLEPWTIPVGWERGTAYARILEPGLGPLQLQVRASDQTDAIAILEDPGAGSAPEPDTEPDIS